MIRMSSLSILLILVGLWVIPSSASRATDFKVYWNVPTFMCDNRDIHINASAFGIIQNKDDVFQGDRVNIWYNPGKFPYLSNGVPVNGGIPQNGSLDDHLATFKSQVETMPEDFNGVAVLDFEHYLPALARAPVEYRKASREWVSSQHPEWTEEEIEAESERSFNSTIRDFMEVILQTGAEMRPNAIWGYYHYPYCKNHGGIVECGSKMIDMNDKTLWIYEASQAMYPSVYLIKSEGEEGRRNMVLGRIAESQRLNEVLSKKIDIYTYCWYRYHDTEEFITPEDIVNSIALSKTDGLQGSVLWGSSGDLNTEEKCLSFKDYFENIFGPLVQDILESSEFNLRKALKSKRYMKKLISAALTHKKKLEN